MAMGMAGRFHQRMRLASSEYFIVGPWNGGDFSSGVDDEETFRRLPADFNGGIWTNRIDRIAPLVRAETR